MGPGGEHVNTRNRSENICKHVDVFEACITLFINIYRSLIDMIVDHNQWQIAQGAYHVDDITGTLADDKLPRRANQRRDSRDTAVTTNLSEYRPIFQPFGSKTRLQHTFADGQNLGLESS